MKKILLVIAIILCIFQIVVLATGITIGQEATNRDSYRSEGNTEVDSNNAANGTGTITSIEIWTNTIIYGAKVATFYVVSGDNLTARDSEIVQVDGQDAGVIPSGSKQTAIVNLNVVEGDFIGLYWTSGQLEATFLEGVWALAGDQTACNDATFSALARRISLKGIGETEEEEEANAIFFGTNF